MNQQSRRHDSLIPLSRDHQPALVAAVTLQRASTAGDPQRLLALAHWIEEWDRRMREHFLDEERLLTPLMEPDERERLFADHDALRRHAEQAREQLERRSPEADLCRLAGERLQHHIRWEERELFPAIEGRATTTQLAALAKETWREEGRAPE